MSYRCGICDTHVSHNKQMKRFVVKRPNGQIEREISICLDCDAGLRCGYTPDEIRRAVATPTNNHKHKTKSNPVKTEDLPPYYITKGDKV